VAVSRCGDENPKFKERFGARFEKPSQKKVLIIFFSEENTEIRKIEKKSKKRTWYGSGDMTRKGDGMGETSFEASQRSLQNEPIFRLLLKVAVIGVHQCE